MRPTSGMFNKQGVGENEMKIYFLSYCFLSLGTMSLALNINASFVILRIKSIVKYLPASVWPKVPIYQREQV